jgi:hypothetical protein
MVHLREPRHHRERKVWVTEVIALATTARGAELVVRRQMPQLFAYEPSVRVEPVSGHAVKQLTYQADPIGKEKAAERRCIATPLKPGLRLPLRPP